MNIDLRKISFLSICMLFAFWALGQNASISGKLLSNGGAAVIGNISVYLENTDYGTVTDKNGIYELKDIKPGSYELVVAGISYATQKEVIELMPDENKVYNFQMEDFITELPHVVVSSVSMTGGNTGVDAIPGSAHYISPKELQRFSYTDINRTLRSVPGINLQEEDGFGLRPNIGLRGVGVERSSKITVMEDGVLMAPAPYTAPAAYYFPTIGRMQAVEVLKGSSQIKYGPYTTGGAINLISTQIPDEFAGRLNIFAGSFGSRNLHANIGDSKDHFGYSIETYQYKADGFKELDGGGNTGFDKKDYLAKFRINTKAEAKVYQSLTFKLGQTNEVSNETYLGLTEEDFENTPFRRYAGSQMDQMVSDHNQFQAQHVLGLSKNLDITTTVYRSEFNRNWYKLDKVVTDNGQNTVKISSLLDDPLANTEGFGIVTGSLSSADDALKVKANNRSYYSQGVQTAINYQLDTKKISHDVELGVRVHQDQVDRFQWVDGYKMDDGVMMLTSKGVPGTESNRIETTDALATYLQYKWGYDNLTIIPGLRYENMFINRLDYGKNDPERLGYDVSDRKNNVDVWIPGIGLDYKFNTFISGFAGVHKGFSPPGSTEGAMPEESTNYEMGIRLNKPFLNGQAIIYMNDYKNLLGSDLAAAGGGGTTDQFNGGEVLAQGVEFQLAYDLLSSSSLIFTAPIKLVYTYTDATFMNGFESDFDPWGDVEEGDKLPYIAHHQIAFLLGLEHKSFGINLSGKFIDEMRTEAGQGAVEPNGVTDSQFIVDFSAYYALNKMAGLFLNVTNLTDEINVIARRPAGIRPGMPRAFNIGLKVNF